MKSKKIIISAFLILAIFIALDLLISWAMLSGVKNHYGLNQKADILLIGHSHLMLATDKERLEKELGMRVSKYTREGVNVSDKKVMVEHFINSCGTDSLKYMLYGVDLATFTGSGLSENSYKLFYPFMDESSIDSYIKNYTDAGDYWLHKLIRTTRFNDDGLKNSAIRGWLSKWTNLKTGVINVEAYRKRLEKGDERHISMNPELMQVFDETVRMMTDRGVRVILVNTPTLDLLNDFEPDKYKQVITWYKDFADKNKMVEFWDFNPKYQSDYSIFSDRLHLNAHGQSIITTDIVNSIKVLENEHLSK